MWRSMLVVGLGSFVGGALRYALSVWMKPLCAHGFPWATLAVNLLGCAVFGVVMGLFSRYSSPPHTVCLLLTTGVCGGFTTFSTFAYEGMQLLHQGNIMLCAVYVLLSVVIGLALAALAYWSVQ